MAVEQICPIWKISANVEAQGDTQIVDSPRAGGKYKIIGSVLPMLQNFAPKEKVKLTDWLIEQREAGVVVPYIDSKVLKHVKSRHEKATLERIKNLILFVAENWKIDEDIPINNNMNALMAYSSSPNNREAFSFMKYCASFGHLEILDTVNFCIKIEGKIYAEEISKEDKKKRQCFVAMWYGGNMNEVYEKAIKPAIIDAGYKPYRVDEDDHNGKIDDQIIAQIRQSRFIFADFTSEEEKPRGGVYYEAGFAHGLGLEVIWACKQELIDKKHIHFDTQQYKHIGWQEDDWQDFYDRIYDSIGANIGWSEDVKDKGTSFVGYKPKQ